MAAEVERMFSVREVPWHKPSTGDRTTVLADYPQTFAEARVLAGLDWDPVAYPVAAERVMTRDQFRQRALEIVLEDDNSDSMSTLDVAEEITRLWEESFRTTGQPVPQVLQPGDDASLLELLAGATSGDDDDDDLWYRIARSDTGKTLSFQRQSYTVIPNSAFGQIIDAVIGTGKGAVKLETGGCLASGRKVWMLARLDEPHQVQARGRIDKSVSYPYLGLTSDHTGKASLASRLTEVRIVCHAQGTPVIDGDWRGEVQNHASATQPRLCAGKEVTIWGLPFCEKVTPEHRYWARAGRKHRGHQVDVTNAQWVYAKDLRPGYHEIGLPVDMTEEAAPAIDLHEYTWRNWTVSQGRDPRLNDPEWWWLLGYWWGNGSLHRGRNNRVAGVALSVNENDADSAQRIERLFRATGWSGKPAAHPGCLTYTLSDATLGKFLETWYSQPGKTPPAWVEQLPLEFQRQLVRGYWDADGDHKTLDGAIISSIGLDGLLALRRILMRLGIPSAIRKGSITAGTLQIQGRVVQVQQSYTIRFWRGVEQLGLTHRFKGRYSLPYIEDGFLWSRVKAVSDTEEEKFWPITTATEDYLTAFGRSHNCANTFSAAEAEGERTGAVYSFSHRGDWRARIGEAREALQFARNEAIAYSEAMSDLLGITVTPQQEQLWLREFISSPSDGVISDRVARNIEEARAAVMGFLNGPTVEGCDIRGTAYGLVQAAGEYLDHARKSVSWESKLNRSLLKAEPLKAKAAVLAREAALA